MPPKPRVPRKSLSKDALAAPGVKQEKDGKSDMPPPPDPLPPTKILEAETNALSGCLKNAVVKTGQIYAFYADTRKLGIHQHAPHPPRSLTAALGREVEKYDQLCDAIESHLLRAISVLQRDLAREEKRIKEAQTGAVATRTRSKSASLSPTSTRVPLPPVAGPLAVGPDTDGPPTQPTPGESLARATPATSVPLGRRASTISLSSLHRPPFPLKLDLSAAGLRMTPEEASLFSNGLTSPVTLAPKSARPTNDLSPELMAAFVSASSSSDAASRPIDIDLTVPDTSNPNATSTGDDVEMNLDPALGNSADKPIELDLEGMDIDMANMTDLFGDSADTSSNDANVAVDGLFSPIAGDPMSAAAVDGKAIKEGEIGMGILDALSAGDGDLFASFAEKPAENGQTNQNKESLDGPPASSSSVTATHSPTSLLESFASVSNLNAPDHTSQPDGDAPFDLLDLSHLNPDFFTNSQETEMNLMEMADFLNMGGDGQVDPGSNVLAGGKSIS